LKAQRRETAFSLIELLTTLAISAFLLLIALPTLSVIIDKQRLESRVELLLLSIKQAKVSAINYNSHIIICRKSLQQTTCAGSSSKGKGDWRDGWLIFDDLNIDHQYQVTEPLIHEMAININRCEILFNRGDYLSFEQFGVLTGGKAGSFKLSCNDQRTQLVVNWVGRVRRQ